MVDGLTDRQRQVLDAIRDAIEQTDRPPSIHELMHALGISSPNGIAKHLAALEAKGYIIREQGARGIRLAEEYAENARSGARTIDAIPGLSYVPLIGQIAAGSPILAEKHVEEVFPMPDSITGNTGDVFFLKVKGESMIEEGIMPGDLVMIESASVVANGELAAVMLEDEATVKRFYKRGTQIILEPANKDYEPIVVDPSETQCSIVGRVVALLRSYKRRF